MQPETPGHRRYNRPYRLDQAVERRATADHWFWQDGRRVWIDQNDGALIKILTYFCISLNY
jgi:hypothetical protein